MLVEEESRREIERLQQMIDESQKIVFFGGAGVSTESGIPDFRSADGLYQQNYKYTPEQVVSHSFFVRNPEAFYEFYKEKMMFSGGEAESSPRKAGTVGACGETDCGDHAEYRWFAPESGE